jgi:dihydroorotase
MNDSIVIKGARLLSFPEGFEGEMDVLVRDGRVAEKGSGLKGGKVVDARGLILAPGLIDMHAHLREPGMEYKEDVGSGSRAAVMGGYSAVFCMPNTEPAIDNSSVAEYVYDLGVDRGLCLVLPHGAVTQGREGTALAPMGEMGSCRAGVLGFSDDGSPVADPEIMRRAMEYARTMGALIISHSEEESLTAGGHMNESYYSTFLGMRGMPSEAEEIAVYRDICLAGMTGARLHLAHLSTARSLELVRSAKKRGLHVTCEVTPHHFSLDDSLLLGYDTNFKMNPPLRSKDDVNAVLEALADGTVDVISTDHAPHASHEKETEFDVAEFGVVGLETALGLALTNLVDAGVLPVEEVLRKMTETPAGIMSMQRWGYSAAVDEGVVANLVLIDPEAAWQVDPASFESRSKNTPFGGWNLKGKAVSVLFRGEFVMRDGVVMEPGSEPENRSKGPSRTGTAGTRNPVARAAKAAGEAG